MPRPAHPWYRQSRGVWMFTDPSGKQVSTGVTDPNDETGAIAARERIIEELAAAVRARLTSVPVAESRPRGRVISETVAAYLAARKSKLSAGAHENYGAILSRFCEAFGARDVYGLTAQEIEDWADGLGVSDSTRNSYLGAVMTWLKWCGYPLVLARPAKESRGADVVLTDEQFAAVLAAYDGANGGDFRALLKVLRETGARPQEAARLTVESVDWQNACSRIREHKNKRHGKSRTLHFSAAAMAILEAQRAKHKSGPLFRTTHGNCYSKKAIVKNMLAISERVGFRAIAYGLGRHSFATRALVRGVPDTVVAALLGHGSTKMVHTNYSHVSEQSRALKAAIEKISSE